MPTLDAVAGADRRGHVANVSLGASATLLARIAELRTRSRLVVVDLPDGSEGYADLRALGTTRSAGELLLVVQRASAPRRHELLWLGAAGLPGGGGRALTSQTTQQRGLVSAVDIAPTILRPSRSPRSLPTCAASRSAPTARCTRRACAR